MLKKIINRILLRPRVIAAGELSKAELTELFASIKPPVVASCEFNGNGRPNFNQRYYLCAFLRLHGVWQNVEKQLSDVNFFRAPITLNERLPKQCIVFKNASGRVILKCFFEKVLI